METIGEYLTRMMCQKNLTPVDLARRCGLTDSYIGRLCKATSSNLTVDTITKLAQALEVNAYEIFAAASGIPVSVALQIDPLLLLIRSVFTSMYRSTRAESLEFSGPHSYIQSNN